MDQSNRLSNHCDYDRTITSLAFKVTFEVGTANTHFRHLSFTYHDDLL
jgi:hypothetical protein